MFRKLVLIAVLVLGLAPSAHAAIAFVSRSDGGDTGSSSSVVTGTLSTSTGNLLTLAVSADNPITTCTSVTDTAGNTWNQAVHIADANTMLEIWYAYNITGNASNAVTCNFNTSSTYRAASQNQFSGVATLCDPKVDAQTGTGNSTSLSTSSINAVTNSVIYAFATFFGATDAWTAGTGYTLTRFAISGDALNYYADEYHIVTAAEAASATHDGASAPWYMGGVSFRDACPAASGGRALLLIGVGK